MAAKDVLQVLHGDAADASRRGMHERAAAFGLVVPRFDKRLEALVHGEGHLREGRVDDGERRLAGWDAAV
jgi:hypothetical protein